MYYIDMNLKKTDVVGSDEKLVQISETETEQVLRKHFELQISNEALESFLEKEFIKASMLSWSYVEEFYFPTALVRLSKFHKLPISTKVIDKANAATLIQYYYLLSHDKVLYDKLEEARKSRNKLIHNLYRSASIEGIDKLAKESADYNLKLIMNDLWDRELGKIPIPSMMIAVNARNELRHEQRERMKELLG